MENEIIIEDFEMGWENAPILENKDKDEYRMCFICKFHMKKDNIEKNFDKRSEKWLITLVNIKKPQPTPENLIAIHSICIDERTTLNYTRILKKVKKQKWLYNEEFYKTEEK